MLSNRNLQYCSSSGRLCGIHYFSQPNLAILLQDAALNTILQIHFTEPQGDILVFLTGQDEIEDLEQMIAERMESFPPNTDKFIICPIYAALPSNVQMRAFEKTPPKHRKIVLATNIAETSVTIEGIKYVVDTGFVKVIYI